MKTFFSCIWTLFRSVFKAVSFFRNLVFNILFLFLLILVIVALFAPDEPLLQDNTALILSIRGDIVEEKQMASPISDIIDNSVSGYSFANETLLQDIIAGIDHAAEDDRITALVLSLSDMGNASIDQLYDIGDALERFKKSYKPVIAAEDSYTQKGYILASYADKIFLNPIGFVNIHGLSYHSLYFKDMLEKLRVNYHIFRVGTYKSAVEPMMRNSMSEEARKQNGSWLNSLWSNISDHIVRKRKINPDVLDIYTNSPSLLLRETKGDAAALALTSGLVDELKTREETRKYLAEISAPSEKHGFRYISLQEYLKIPKGPSNQPDLTENSIGVIVAQGNILPGEQPPGTIGSETLSRKIRQAGMDDSIKAVVLRINSSGGSVVASELIRQEILEFKKTGKPFVVSMSGVAASGGYWIAADADEIWAYPTTITGSIGIFGAIATFEESLASLGIASDGVDTTAISGSMDLTRPLSQEIKNVIQLTIENGYDTFISIVAGGRNLSIKDTEALAQGRIYDGKTAHSLGLVDNLGGLEQAIASAADLASLNDYSIEYIEETGSFTDMIWENLQQSLIGIHISKKLHPVLSHLFTIFQPVSAPFLLFQDPKNMYAHCLIAYL